LDFLSNTFEKCEETYIDEKKKWDDWNQRNKKKLENKKSISKKDKEDTQDEEKIEPKLSISINGNLLARKISDKRNWIEKKVEEYNKHGNNNELRLFLIRCKKVFDCASIIFFRENRFLSCLFEGKINQHRSSFESTRLKLPIDKIFDTGLNFSVFGEAGAGKTTCLQMYTISKQNDSNRLYIYLPLSRVIQNSYSFNPKDKKYDKYSRLEMGIAKYLSYSGISITFEQFQIFIKSKKITLLLDGIDEAIKKAPWLINEISMLSEKYIDNIQLIVTSRASGPYLDEIPFITITLLPFTDEQKNHFIDSWFGPLKKIVASDIKTHFRRNKALSELVNNPLLTTILCVLAENCLPLPNTEIKLYNDRLDLLTGYYDNVKNISRLITPPDTLKTLAQKLAFYLHSNSKREEDLFELEKISVRLMLNKLRPEASQDALKELIDPCNVLVPMTDDGKFGFGHLRFQEHLAAKEIINNRGIRITPMLNQGWWRSVLLFFANMNDDLHWLIQSLGQENEITSIRKVILLDMINVRPLNERKKLESILKKYLSLEGWNYLDE